MGQSGSRLDRFAGAAEAAGATVHRVGPTEAAPTLETVVEAPAVGVPLDLEGVELPPAVETAVAHDRVRAARTGVTPAVLGVVEHGSVAVETGASGAGAASTYPERHVAVLRESALVPDLPSALEALGPRLGNGGDVVLVAAPSATADMGETVRGVHGPAELHLVVVGDG